MKLHYSQTFPKFLRKIVKFYYHMKLHYSQTRKKASKVTYSFYYHMKLHYSQTMIMLVFPLFGFYYHMKLHYSQTLLVNIHSLQIVLLPYEITLLSNLKPQIKNYDLVSSIMPTTTS